MLGQIVNYQLKVTSLITFKQYLLFVELLESQSSLSLFAQLLIDYLSTLLGIQFEF